MKINVFLLFLAVESSFADDYFSSVHSLKDIYKIEKDLLENFKSYSSKLKIQLDLFKKDIAHIKGEHKKAQENVGVYFENPINAFHLIKRLHVDFKLHFTKIQSDGIFEDFRSKMDSITNQENYPTEDEFSGSASAFVRLQETYNLEASELASGVIAGLKTSDVMSWDDCFYLGQKLYELGDQNHTQEWLREAFTKFYSKFNDDEESMDILETIANMTLHLHDLDTTRNITEIILKVNPNHFTAQVAKELIESLPENFESAIPKPEYNPSIYLSPQHFRDYEAVCRDDLKRSPSEMKDLHCKYESYNNAFLKLAPFRLEILNMDPRVVMFHDVLYECEIKHLKKKALPTIKRSAIGADGLTKSKVRTSLGGYTSYLEDSVLESLVQRIEDMTRQTIKGTESVQVANYGMGGHYEPHYDCFGPNMTNYVAYEESGDRISTAMFYVSDVDLGGSTAFTFLRLNVKPVKGSMVFWYNLHASGNKDFRTRHAGCPVIKGSKWIFNFWMRIKWQIFHRRCELEDDTWKSKHLSYLKF